MANMFDYLSWRGDLSFGLSPFNPVDNIIFSQLSYLPLEGIVPGPDEKKGITIARAAAIFAEKQRGDSAVPDEETIRDASVFFSALGKSKRYQNCVLRGFVSLTDVSQEKQFSAVTIIIGRRLSFIAYRGTDTSLVGWKEDFNMSFNDAVPAQLEAVTYLERMAKKIWGPLRLGGHSKGGNLAIYASSFCKKRIRRRISAIYSNDAPGFNRRIIESGGFQEIRDRIQSFVPQSSLVGMLFEHDEDYAVVKSSQSGLMQHDLYSWEVTHNDMIRLDKTTQRSRFIDKTLSEWISGLDNAHRQQFIDAVYATLTATQAKSIPELTADWFKSAMLIIQSLKNVDDPTRNIIKKTIGSLFRAAKNNIETLRPPKEKTDVTPD